MHVSLLPSDIPYLDFAIKMGDNAAPPVTNDVTMQGSGVYSAHSDLQHEVMLQALPLIEKAAKTLATQSSGQVMTVAEYGAAQGANS